MLGAAKKHLFETELLPLFDVVKVTNCWIALLVIPETRECSSTFEGDWGVGKWQPVSDDESPKTPDGAKWLESICKNTKADKI